jgi:mannose-6-phosphate isomerase
MFNVSYGKTECWHILRTRDGMDEPACVYIGFKEHVTREIWKDLFDRQDVAGMLDAMHRIDVKPGDTILVTGGTPHAIGAGCFLLEIQEPSDYTMRTEKVTLAGQVMTPQQIHYGVGEENMLDCFDYTPKTRADIERMFLLKARDKGDGSTALVTYHDTTCFALSRVDGGEYRACEDCFVTVVAIADGGTLTGGGDTFTLSRGDKFFIPAKVAYELKGASAILCYPPKV